MLRPRPSRTAHRPFRRPPLRPRLERLEDRCLLSAGGLDLTFGTAGVVNIAGISFRKVTTQPSDGKIIALGGGWVPESNNGAFVVARFNTDGSLDDGGPNDLTPGDSFGQGGLVQVVTLGGSPTSRMDIAVRPDGMIVLVGTAMDQQTRISRRLALISGTDGTVVRYFFSSYVAKWQGAPQYQEYMAVSVQEDNHFLVGGHGRFTTFGPEGLFVQRFDPTGTLVQTSELVELVTVGGLATDAHMAVQPDGKIVMVNPVAMPTLVRFNTNLTLDTTFGVDGRLTLDITPNTDNVRAIAIDGDGKILLAGNHGGTTTNPALAVLARVTADGSGLDASFNNGQGYLISPVITDPNLTTRQFLDVAVQANGKIVTVAQAIPSNLYPSLFILARFNANGTPDLTFGSNGVAISDVGARSRALTIQPNDGKIVVVGDEIVARYLGDPVQADQTITFAPLPDVTYGAEPFALTATASSGLPVSFSIVSGPATLAGNTVSLTGTGTVIVRASQAGNQAYNPAVPVERSFLVAPAPLTVTVDDDTRLYGDANPAFSVHYSGFVYGENQSALGGTLVFATPADLTSPVGDYPVTASGLTAANYALHFVAGTLSVTPAPLTLTAHDASRVYGTANAAFTGTLTGLKNNDAISATFTTSATAASPPGTYPIVPTAVDADPPRLGNYTVTLVPGTLTVTKAMQTITWNAPTSLLFGTPLDAEQLNATVSVPGPDPNPGALTFDPPAGTVLPVGIHVLTVTAAETDFYHAATASVPVQVLAPASLSGMVFLDLDNNGEVDFGENGIAGVTITLSGTDDLGRAVLHTQQTNSNGTYLFLNLRPGNYTITEAQPTGYEQGINLPGTLGGTVLGDQFFIELAEGAHGLNYNFAERLAAGVPVSPGQTATIGFWNNRNGQALIRSLNGGVTATQLGNWLAANFANLFGIHAGANNLAGKNNAQVAAFLQMKSRRPGAQLDAEVLAAALSVYVTNQELAGNVAASYGFQVSATGLGGATYNVGTSGEAFGVANHTTLTVMDLLRATDSQAVNGVLYYDPDPARMNYLRELAHAVYSSLNGEGAIG